MAEYTGRTAHIAGGMNGLVAIAVPASALGWPPSDRVQITIPAADLLGWLRAQDKAVVDVPPDAPKELAKAIDDLDHAIERATEGMAAMQDCPDLAEEFERRRAIYQWLRGIIAALSTTTKEGESDG